ncbi:MAG: hypothetical protein ACLFWB_13895 [Armatimonadota bacterium]
MSRMVIVAAIVAVTVGAVFGASFQGNSVTMSVTPEMPFVGGQVTVSGSSGPYQDDRTVPVVLTRPDGQTEEKTTELTDDATFEVTFGPLLSAGEWTAEATVPLTTVTNETAIVEFEVYQPTAVAAVSIRGFTEGTDQMADFIQVTGDQIDRFTELPDRDAARQQVTEVQNTLSSVDSGLQEVADTFDELSSAMDALQGFPEMTEAMGSLATTVQGPLNEIRSTSAKLRYTHEQANNAREWCRTWHAQKEGLKILKDMVMIIFGGTAAIKGWVSGQFTGAIISTRDKLAAETAGEVLGLTDAQVREARAALKDCEAADKRIKELMDPEGNLGNWAQEALSGGLNWLIDWVAQKVAPNCRMYEADTYGKLEIEYYAKNMVYMVTRYDWEGKIQLFFQKRQSETDIVRLKGQIWGNFGWRTGEFYPERTAMDIPGVTGVGLCIPRPPWPDIRDFYLSLEGEGKPDGIECWVTATEYDRERLPFGFVSVLWSPYQIVPAVDVMETKVPGGEWFVTRATDLSKPDVDRFWIPLEVIDDKVVLKHTFERTMDYRENGEFRAFLKLEIDGSEGGI